MLLANFGGGVNKCYGSGHQKISASPTGFLPFCREGRVFPEKDLYHSAIDIVSAVFRVPSFPPVEKKHPPADNSRLSTSTLVCCGTSPSGHQNHHHQSGTFAILFPFHYYW
ncbi:hypothetical protein EXU57_10350 [Segetibacter sp. 3557_3]|uniref:hypothetical protein n=1 Tax=Segetibacter sp. 3557_3 TaxID=2547429 RepID=UPI001058A19E|nr:hypothetical protein [Segetibacter sp. 3557_3]TDH26483.1 hypothetical protein EXU57_10350 [Segetibacter sp. 3557_3]